MPPLDNDALLKRLLATFRVEADEHLDAITALLAELEEAPRQPQDQARVVESLFREAHSLKGAARAVNLADVEALCADLEGRLAALKKGEIESSPELLDTLRRTLDELGRLLARTNHAGPAGGDAHSPPAAAPGAAAAPAPRPTVPVPPIGQGEREARTLRSAPAPVGETVRVSTARLSALLVQSEALLAHKFSSGHLVAELRSVASAVSERRRSWQRVLRSAGTIRRRRSAERNERGERQHDIDRLVEAVERDDWLARDIEERLARLLGRTEQEQRALAGLIDCLQEDMREALMQPFSSLLELLPRLARDLARDSGKEVALAVEGAAIEVDRRILEALKDPLIHLLRNAVDHGIEPPAERARRGKAAQGRIRIALAARENNRVELTLADDGAGIDLERVKSSAADLGLVSADRAPRLEPQEALSLVFASGLSTREALTDLSGRGLGLAIVREKVEMLGGSITAELPPEGGTLFRMVLPTVLATFRGVLVAVGEHRFILPAASVSRVLRVPIDAVRTVENRAAVEIEGTAVALVRLAEALGLEEPPRSAEATFLQAVVVEHGRRHIAFGVDGVLDDQEVLVKGLGPQLRRVPNVAGATVLESGRLVPILDVADLFASASRARPGSWGAPTAPAPRPSLLVVEDSVTSRALLKSILESAGYAVTTAVDGVDALAALDAAHFELVVSDVEMPRMDGFELTARLRRDERHAGLPVVLVTALDSPEHKARGLEAGADAYLVKSSFDQSDLLEAIRRLT